jgi:hypothetical protein
MVLLTFIFFSLRTTVWKTQELLLKKKIEIVVYWVLHISLKIAFNTYLEKRHAKKDVLYWPGYKTPSPPSLHSLQFTEKYLYKTHLSLWKIITWYAIFKLVNEKEFLIGYLGEYVIPLVTSTSWIQFLWKRFINLIFWHLEMMVTFWMYVWKVINSESVQLFWICVLWIFCPRVLVLLGCNSHLNPFLLVMQWVEIVRPRYSATVCSLQFVAMYRGWWWIEMLRNGEFLFIDRVFFFQQIATVYTCFSCIFANWRRDMGMYGLSWRGHRLTIRTYTN